MKNPKQTQNPISSNVLANYMNMTVRGLVALLVGIGAYLLLVNIFNVSYVFMLPIVFLISLVMSPLLSKIRVGDSIQLRYYNFLNKIIKRLRKWQNLD